MSATTEATAQRLLTSPHLLLVCPEHTGADCEMCDGVAIVEVPEDQVDDFRARYGGPEDYHAEACGD